MSAFGVKAGIGTEWCRKGHDEKWALEAKQAAHRRFHQFAHEREWFKISWQDFAAWFGKQGAKPRLPQQ
jgi:hypothetical protein